MQLTKHYLKVVSEAVVSGKFMHEVECEPCNNTSLAPLYIHQMNRVNSRNGSAMNDSTINIVLDIIIIIIIIQNVHQYVDGYPE